MGGRLFPERARSQLVADTWGEGSGGKRENPGAGRSRGSPRQGWLGQPPSAQAGLRP
jgi:hypothetical protein